MGTYTPLRMRRSTRRIDQRYDRAWYAKDRASMQRWSLLYSALWDRWEAQEGK